MSSGSLKDVIKALTTTFTEPNVPYPLPSELTEAAEAFLDTHRHVEEHDAERLHEELLSVYNKHVAPISDNIGPFVATLRSLQPAITGEKRLEQWWSLVIRPVVDEIGQRRDTIEDAKEFLLGVMVYDVDDAGAEEKAVISSQFTTRLLDCYIARTKLPSETVDVVSPEDEFIGHELENILVAFGRKKPKELLLALDELLIKKDCRLQALTLLSSFVRLQPPHLHLVLETAMPGHLLNCLLIDTSATVVELALTILIMFLPHITTCLTSILPKLFLVYARILCWDQFSRSRPDSAVSPMEDDVNPSTPRPAMYEDDSTWEQLLQDPESLDISTPRSNYLFTFLYGLFPLNFMTFVRKPRRYLKMKNYPGAEALDLNQGMIRTRTETHRNVHLLHPNFFTTTPEDELIDNRWLKAEPADLVSECLALCVAKSTILGDPGPPPTAELPALPRMPKRPATSASVITTVEEQPQTNGVQSPSDPKFASWRSASSTTLMNPGGQVTDSTRAQSLASPRASFIGKPTRFSHAESPPMVPLIDEADLSLEATLEQDTMAKFPAPPMSPPVGTSPPSEKSPEIPDHASVARSPTTTFSQLNDFSSNSAALQREILLLRNDLKFERYLKQQHLAHIGQLQRKHISEATVESETLNLLNTNKNLKHKLQKSNDLYTQLKKETATSRSQSKKYEEQLSGKIRTYRDEERRWRNELDTLRHDYQKLRLECEQLRRIVEDSESRELEARNELVNLERQLEETDQLREHNTELEARLQEYEIQDLDYDRLREDHEILRSELETVQMDLVSRDAERERTRQLYDGKINILEQRLRTAQMSSQNGQLPASVQQMIDSALASSNSKLAQLKRTHQRLLTKHTELELQNQELQSMLQEQQLQQHHQQKQQKHQAPSHQRQASQEGPRASSVLSMTHYADEATMMGLSNSSLGRQNSLRSTPAARRPHAFSDPALMEHDDIIPEESLVPQSPTEYSDYDRAGSSYAQYPPTQQQQQPQQQQQLPPPTYMTGPRSPILSHSASLRPLRVALATTTDINGDRIERTDVQGSGALAPAFETGYTHDFRPRLAEQGSMISSKPSIGDISATATTPLPTPLAKQNNNSSSTVETVRYSGRGGAQSHIKKVKDRDAAAKKEKSGKTGGFRGLKGIM